MQNVLVTGGAGFVGSHIVDALIEAGKTVTILDDFSNGRSANINPGVRRLIGGSILETKYVQEALAGVDVVFHEAAMVDVAKCESNPKLVHQINFVGGVNVLSLAKAEGVKHVIVASTAAVYGRSEMFPRRETQELLPTSEYAKSKQLLEKYAYDFQWNDMRITILRYFNIYGLRSTAKAYSGAINVFAKNLIHREPITIFGDGTQSRDFINVADIVQANMLVAEKQKTSFEIFNVGTGVETSVNELVRLECNILDKPHPRVLREPPRAGDTYRSYADITKIRGLGFEPRYTVEKGLTDYLRREYLQAYFA